MDTPLPRSADGRGISLLQLALPRLTHALSPTGHLQFASYVLFWLCLLKVQAGAVASATLLPTILYEANAWGVPHWLPAFVSIALGASAASLMARESAPEQRSAAWVLCLAGCAFADRPLMLCGWWAPQLEMGLWLVVPWCVRYLRKGSKASVRFFRLMLIGFPILGFLSMAPYSILDQDSWHLWPPWIPGTVGYGGLLALAAYAAFKLGRMASLARAAAVTCSLALTYDIVASL